jgi:hypothetical protein
MLFSHIPSRHAQGQFYMLSIVQVALTKKLMVDSIQGRPAANQFKVPYFPAYSAHLTYNAHPKLFCIPFEVQITRT